MKVFVTGIAGFLGSNIADELIEQGHEVSGCDTLFGGYLDNVPEKASFHQADCGDFAAMRRLIAGFEVVIHTACVAYEGFSVFSPALVTQHTSQISSTVFSACAANRIPRVINCSSMARYGSRDGAPFVETMTPRPQDPYGVAKVAAEQLLAVLSDVHGLEYVNFVPHNILGKRQKYDDPFRNVAAIMLNRMLKEQQPIIYGDGSQTRCFSDVRDVVPCFVRAVTEQAPVGETINIGPDEEVVSIRELAELIADVIGFASLDPIFVDPRPQEVRNAVCSADKARRLLGYETRYSLTESIESLASWIETRGPRPFRYHLDIEIPSPRCPKVWSEHLL